jgi:probable DNA repair protein
MSPLAALAAGATVVTPTRRLAGALRAAYDTAQQAHGRAAWRSPDVLPWAAWLQRQWQTAAFAAPLPVLLDAQQEAAIWERVIHESPEAGRLLHLDAAAGEAREAWHMVCAYRLGEALRRAGHGDETAAFLGWSEAFVHFCGRERLIDGARLPEELIHQFAAGKLDPPAHLVTFGFDAVDPQRAALMQTLVAAGARVEELQPDRPQGRATLAVHAGAEQEIHAAGAWAHGILARAPDARIGVVVPNLGALRTTIARIFDDVLVPDAALTPGRVRARPWNLSLGLPLLEWPVVHAALQILALAQGGLPAAAAGALLRSPFLGGSQNEYLSRALLDARLAALREPHVDLDLLEREAAWESRLHAAPLLLEGLRRLRQRARGLMQEQHPPSAWGPRLQALLAALRWPGERALDSEEYQTVAAWRELVAGLARFDPIHRRIAYPAALHLVRRLAAEHLFQPETPEVPVQILGVLESAGLTFDHLMVLGLHAEVWPRPARPNPLLPVDLQRRAGVPGGSPDWELDFARRMMAGWVGAAPDVVFSHPAAEGDRALRASPLLEGIAQAAPAAAADATDYRRVLLASRQVEVLEDVAVRPLPAGGRASGGTALLRDQAACSFRAFAAHRLGADSVEHPGEGLDAAERGTLVHAALAHLWGALRDSATLAALDPATLEAHVREAVGAGLAPLMRRRRSLFQTRYLELERERLAQLLLEWLEVDRARPPFAVLPPEQAQEAQIGGVRLRVRLDRVDRLADGGELLIDYKTGDGSVAHWFGERPDDPQLPAYATLRGERPAGLAFAIVKRGHCRMQGLAQQTGVGEGVAGFAAGEERAADWRSQLDAWAATLDALGRQFRGTEVRVNPKRYPDTCRYCGFAALCRVEELLDRADEDADDD